MDMIKLLTKIRDLIDAYLKRHEDKTEEATFNTDPSGKVVICVGHSRSGDPGARACDDSIYEWHYNRTLAHYIDQYLPETVETVIIDRYPGASYKQAMDNLKLAVDPLKADLVIELHFNSAENKDARGFEILRWHTSQRGFEYATAILNQFKAFFPTHPNRGIKSVEGITQRGGRFLMSLKAPALILEPFFGSNEKDWEVFKTVEGKMELGKSIAKGITLGLRLRNNISR